MLPLDSPLWAELPCADGVARDVPLLLSAIALDPTTSALHEGAWFELWSGLCHQGDVYPASFAAVPHVIETLANNPGRACYDFFLFPASIELARQRRSVPVPAELREAYQQALHRLPSLAGAEAGREWDPTLCRSILASVAVAKSQLATAELLLDIDDDDTAEVLDWYFSR